MNNPDYIDKYLSEVTDIVQQIDKASIKHMINIILEVRRNNGRLFMLGVGGGAGNASHAVNDFRKIAAIESYAPTDNVSELTARINDEGWDLAFVNWLKLSRLNSNDCIFVFSVGGGNIDKNISNNLVQSLKYAKKIGSKVIGIVGRDGGYTAKVADAVVIIPKVNSETITPHTEEFQAVVWHMMVSHPDLKEYEMKWESMN